LHGEGEVWGGQGTSVFRTSALEWGGIVKVRIILKNLEYTSIVAWASYRLHATVAVVEL
jgi:hypothetical protein